MNTHIRRQDAVIQRNLDRGMWRPSLDTGHIYSTDKQAYLKETINNRGYCTVGAKKDILVSRVIWIAAHGIPDAGMEVDHINGNCQDNRLENLQLITLAENRQRSRAVLTFAEAEEIRCAYETGLTQKKLADLYGVSRAAIHNIVRGITYKTRPPHEMNAEIAVQQMNAMSEKDKTDICQEYTEGASCRQIASRRHITRTTVRAVLRENNIGFSPNIGDERR